MVIGCNRQVGITIVDANNKDIFIVCYAGPILPGHQPDEFKDITVFFNTLVEQVQNGYVDVSILQNMQLQNYGKCTGANCAYSR